jgi:hypothetical protein
MAKLSKAHQAKFRAAYVRYHELRLEMRAASSALKIANFAKWAGVLLLLVSVVRTVLGRDWPSFVPVVALCSAIAGWAYALDKKRELDRLDDEWREIRETAKAAGAYISDIPGYRLRVYAGEISDENIVDPLSEDAYE